MNPEDNILDTSQLHFNGDFNEQVDYLLYKVRLSREEVETLDFLFHDLESTLQEVWPGCAVFPFGSIITGLGIKTSDSDCYVSLPQWVTNKDQAVLKAKQVLSRYYTLFTQLFAIPQAKVPIVKFCHVPTNISCDVNFKSPAGVENSKLIGYLLRFDERAMPLAIIIKYWSKVYRLTGTNLLPNYALTLLVIFYLQQVNIVPSVLKLQRSVQEHMIDDWNTAFNTDYNADNVNNKDSLYELLGGFFNYYRNFDFKSNAISPYLGQPINKNFVQRLRDLPDDFEIYKHNLRNGICKPLRTDSFICIQDPFEHCRNCTVAVGSKLVQNIMFYIKNVARIYTEYSRNDFLKEMLTQLPGNFVRSQNTPIMNRHLRGVVKRNSQFKPMKKNLKKNIHTLYSQYCKARKS